MNIYLIPIKEAIAVFPLLAIIITFPYMIYQYRKYGSIPLFRSVIMYSFVLYLSCMYFLVILPLPSISEVAGYTGPQTQLVPFQFVRNFLRETTFRISSPGTWLNALTQNCFLQVLFNILLFLPLGVYLRYYFRCSWKKVLLISFSLSLFFELTQLSGLYGIYPRGYRLFDVDDLMLNTGGGMLGYISSAIIMRLLPSREHLDKIAYEKGLHVSFCRRLAAFVLDWTILAVIGVPTVILTTFMPPVFFLIQFAACFFLPVFYFVLCTYLTDGYTPGKWLLKIRISSCDAENRLTLQQCILRFGTLYLIFIPFLMIWACYHLFCSCTGRSRSFIYERLSRTDCISTIQQDIAHPKYHRHFLLSSHKI